MTRILRFTRRVAEPGFYRDALGFRTIAPGIMRLGTEEIALLPGAPDYPPDSRSNDLWFQHLAIVVSDMDAAYAHLSAVPGWRAISEAGPQLLPPENGGVRAFKFRDPDGNPLELLWFPPGQGRAVWQARHALFLGIDHNALAVADAARSLAFYQGLGFGVSGRTLNHGPAQSRLDGLANARVQVTALRAGDGPGLELLAYDPPGRAGHVSADLVTLGADLRDPDGHRLALVDQGAVVPV